MDHHNYLFCLPTGSLSFFSVVSLETMPRAGGSVGHGIFFLQNREEDYTSWALCS